MKHQYEAPRDLTFFNSLLPAPACVTCEKTLPEIGGQRITAQGKRGIAVWGECGTLHDRFNLVESLRLIEGEEIFLVVWGEKEIFTGEVVDRIKATYLSGVRPWMCQGEGCGDRACPACGKAMKMTPSCDVLHENGKKLHMMVVMGNNFLCTNVDCEKYREFGDDWGIVKYQMQ